MGFNSLTEIYSRDELETAMINESIRKSAFWTSGAVEIDPSLSNLVGSGEGRLISRIGYEDLADPLTTGNAVQATTHNPGYPDDSDTDLIPNANSTYQYNDVKTVMAYSMGEKEIIKTCSFLEDPISALNGRVSDYWSRVFDMYATHIVQGIYNENVLNDSSDMVAGDGLGAITPELILDGFATFGDAANIGGSVMVCNSAVAFVLRKAQLIDTIPSADNPSVMFEYFQGNRMLVSNKMFVDTTCVTALIEAGSLSFGESSNNIIASEPYRRPTAGVGGGESQLITRKQFAMGCKGYSWLDATVTGSVASGSIPGSSGGTKLWPSIVDMSLAANWNRVLDRKKVKIAFIHTSETPAT